MIDNIKYELKVLSNRGKFIKAIIEGKIKVNNIPKAEIVVGIEKLGLDKIDGNYDYLLRMPIWSLTKEMYDKIKEDYLIKNKELEELSKVEPRDMYLDDLSELKKKLKV
jgi:DNA topoisomerase-2